MTNTQLTDLEYLKTTCGGSMDLVRNILQSFLDKTPEIISDMRKNFSEKNLESLKGNAHKAKSTFLIIGAQLTGKKLESIEHNALAGEENAIEGLMTDVEQESQLIYNELQSFMDNT